jgi:hypothetical protein
MQGTALISLFMAICGSMVSRVAILVNLSRPTYLNLPCLSWSLPKFKTHYISLLIVGSVQILCLFIPFHLLIQIMNNLYCFVIITISIAYIYIQFKNRHYGKICIGLSPICMGLILIGLGLVKTTIPFFGSVLVIGLIFILYFIFK